MMNLKMCVDKRGIFAMKLDGRITVDVPTVIMLVNGEIIVQHQKCGDCRPKTTTLTQAGSHLVLEADMIYRIRNNTMERADYLLIYPVVNPSE